MNLEKLQELKNTPRDQQFAVVETLANELADHISRDFRLRRHVNLALKRGKVQFPKDFEDIISGVMFQVAKSRYTDEDGVPLFNNTIVTALATSDISGEHVPQYIKDLPGWKKVQEAGFAD